MKSRYAVLIVCTFLLINQLSGQVVKYNDTFTLYYPNTSKIFVKGLYKNSLPEGRWEFYYPEGNLSEIHNYKKGLLNDSFYRFYSSGFLMIKGYYTNNLKNGLWLYDDIVSTYINDTLQGWQRSKTEEIYFVNGKANGPYYSFTFKGDTIIKGQYVNNSREGIWVVTGKGFREPDKYSIHTYRNNKLEDTSYYYNRDTLIKKTYYKNGLKQGVEFEYHSYTNHTRPVFKCKNCFSTVVYEDGLKHGIHLIVNFNGDTLFYSEYADGKRNGTTLIKNNKGIPIEKFIYTGGSLPEQSWKWDANGTLRERTMEKRERGYRIEFIKKWDTTGKVEYMDSLYHIQKASGQDTYEYIAGELIREKHYINWKPHGRWFKKGKYDLVYNNGKLVKTVFGDDITKQLEEEQLLTDVGEEDFMVDRPETPEHDFRTPNRLHTYSVQQETKNIHQKAKENPHNFKGKVKIKVYVPFSSFGMSHSACARVIDSAGPVEDGIALRQALETVWQIPTVDSIPVGTWKEITVEF